MKKKKKKEKKNEEKKKHKQIQRATYSNNKMTNEKDIVQTTIKTYK